jgi:hypothetical protein
MKVVRAVSRKLSKARPSLSPTKSKRSSIETSKEENPSKEESPSKEEDAKSSPDTAKETAKATVLQSVWRGKTVRKSQAAIAKGAVAVQSVLRGPSSRSPKAATQ